jgi:hypothetical protein
MPNVKNIKLQAVFILAPPLLFKNRISGFAAVYTTP